MATDFGRDTSCTDALRPGQIVSGVRLVAEAVYRRLTTPRGALRGGEEEADYGFDIFDLVGAVTSPAELAAIPGRVRNEVLKDERVESVTVRATTSRTGPAVKLVLELEATTREGPFALQLAATDVTTELLGITTAEAA